MKKSFIFCCLLATSLSGCSSADKPIFGCGNYVKTSTISIESGYGGTANDVIDKRIARKAVTATYPADYTYRENWKDTNRGEHHCDNKGTGTLLHHHTRSTTKAKSIFLWTVAFIQTY